jgi:hypothetical protein
MENHTGGGVEGVDDGDDEEEEEEDDSGLGFGSFSGSSVAVDVELLPPFSPPPSSVDRGTLKPSFLRPTKPLCRLPRPKPSLHNTPASFPFPEELLNP